MDLDRTQVDITLAKWFCAGGHQGEASMIKNKQKLTWLLSADSLQCMVPNWMEDTQFIGNYMIPGHG